MLNIDSEFIVSEMVVRQATLADTYPVTDIHCGNVGGGVFTRRNSDGTRTPTPYEALSLFERYLNGGPWMSVETCAVWLAYLLQHGDEIPLVAELDGHVMGEAEVTIGYEPAPYGQHLHITTLKVHPEALNPQAVADALINYIKQMARVMRFGQVTTVDPSDWFAPHEFKPLIGRREVTLSAKEGRIVYKATTLSNYLPEQIKGWNMPFGRYNNARHEWAHIWPGFWNAVPELVEPEVARYQFELSGQVGICLLQQNRYSPAQADVYLWTQRPLSAHMISAVRDRAARQGYQNIALFVDDQTRAMVENEASESGSRSVIASLRV